MFEWVFKRLEGYSPAYDRDQLIAVVATIIFAIADTGLHVFFAILHYNIIELSLMNVVSICLSFVALYYIIFKYRYVLGCYLIVLIQCFYIIYTTFVIGYEKGGVILYPVLLFASHSVLKVKKKHLRNITNIILASFVFTMFVKTSINAKYEGQLMYTEYINGIFAVGGCLFIIEAKIIAEKFVDKYSTNVTKGLSKEAYQDYLTGLWNRRFMEKEFAKMNKYTNGVIVLADIDFFKTVNDTYGHNTGDYVLKKVSDIYRNGLRDNDVICRWGGEEFFFYIKNVSEETAIKTVENIREKIEKTTFSYEENKFYVTVSFGICEIDTGVSIEENIDRADKAMYYCKNNGRNRVASYNTYLESLYTTNETMVISNICNN